MITDDDIHVLPFRQSLRVLELLSNLSTYPKLVLTL